MLTCFIFFWAKYPVLLARLLPLLFAPTAQQTKMNVLRVEKMLTIENIFMLANKTHSERTYLRSVFQFKKYYFTWEELHYIYASRCILVLLALPIRIITDRFALD